MLVDVLEKLIKKLKEYPANIGGDKDFEVYIRKNTGRVSPLYDIQKISINYRGDEPCLILEVGESAGLNNLDFDENTVISYKNDFKKYINKDV